MRARTFQARLLWLIVAVLALLEAGTLVSVHFAGQRTLRHSVEKELQVGAHVFERTLQDRADKLAFLLGNLALDFAFRETVASGDVPTINSALTNIGKRVETDTVLLLDLDGNVRADAMGRFAGERFPFGALLAEAQERGKASQTISLSNRPYQFVIVPVRAPQPIAWLCAGFEIDEKALSDVRRLTSLDVSLWSSTAGLISTLAPDERNELLAQIRAAERSPQTTLRLGNAEYATFLQPLRTADNSRMSVLLQRNLAEAREPFAKLELQIFALSLIMLA